MRGQGGDAKPSVAGNGHATINIERAAADEDAGANAVLDGAVEDMDQRVKRGHAEAAAVLNSHRIKINARLIIHDNTAATVNGKVLDSDLL